MELKASSLDISKPIKFSLGTETPIPMRVCKIAISNGNDEIAENVTGVCESVNGVPCEDDAFLKWAGMEVNARDIHPQSSTYLGLLEYRNDGIYLHNFSDNRPAKPIISEPGIYDVTFRVCSKGFDILRFKVKVNYLTDLFTNGG